MNIPAEDLNVMKREARAAAKHRLRGLTPVRGDISARIIRHLVNSSLWSETRVAMAYLSLPSEVNLDGLWSNHPRPILAAARVDWDAGTMRPVVLDDPALGTQTRAHGVREPVDEGHLLEPASLDVVLVPGLAFDTEGRRLGRGGGFYDRFLAEAPRASRIGVCWSGQIIDCVPTGPGDERVHMLLTEQGLHATE